MAISAADVQRAYTSNVDIAGALQQAEAMRQRQEALDQERRRQNDQDLFNLEKYNDLKYKTATNTPADEVINSRVRKAELAVHEALRKNKGNLTVAQARALQAPYLLDIEDLQKTSLGMRANLDKHLTAFEKEYPSLDRNKVEYGALKKWYDDKGEVKMHLDPNELNDYFASLTDPKNQINYINDRQHSEEIKKSFDGLSPVPYKLPIGEGLFLDGTKMPYHAVDATGNLSIQSEPILAGGQQLPAMYGVPSVNNQQVNAVPREVAQIFENNYPVQLEVQRRLKKLENLPIPEEDKKRAVLYEVVNEFQSNKGIKPASFDSELARLKMAERAEKRTADNQAFSRRMQMANYNLSAQKEKRYQQAVKDANVAQSWIGIMKDDPESLKKAHAVVITPPVPMGVKNGQPNFVPGKQKVSAIDLTAQLPNGLVAMPDGSGTKLKIYKDNATGGIWMQEYKPVKKDGSTRYEPDEASWKEVPRDEAVNLINSLEAQLNKKVTPYEPDVEGYVDMIE